MRLKKAKTPRRSSHRKQGSVKRAMSKRRGSSRVSVRRGGRSSRSAKRSKSSRRSIRGGGGTKTKIALGTGILAIGGSYAAMYAYKKKILNWYTNLKNTHVFEDFVDKTEFEKSISIRMDFSTLRSSITSEYRSLKNLQSDLDFKNFYVKFYEQYKKFAKVLFSKNKTEIKKVFTEELSKLKGDAIVVGQVFAGNGGETAAAGEGEGGGGGKQTTAGGGGGGGGEHITATGEGGGGGGGEQIIVTGEGGGGGGEQTTAGGGGGGGEHITATGGGGGGGEQIIVTGEGGGGGGEQITATRLGGGGDKQTVIEQILYLCLAYLYIQDNNIKS